ncbi:MAG: NAD(P)H-quinone oxidoreductase [Myxococcales bacterium]|nr:NAD(P)H-quinone oxidoreductase [Myxococcota bacterium]MDW8281944.1 NAD(P)H-quinone oxidoreductase [Myxococcales bacterium]
MRAILVDNEGELVLGEVPDPVCGDDELRIEVRATAVNRADLLQRRGLYPPPEGASPILGLEAAGRVLEAGPAARAAGFAVGQRVMALLAGGGYAEQVTMPFCQAMPVPARLSDEEAAAVPEAFLTAFLNLFLLGGLPWRGEGKGETPPPTVLIHGGASGVGTAALQLCRASGVTALCTVGSQERGVRCQALGAAFFWDYHRGDFAPAVLAYTEGRGVDLVLDCIGGPYLEQNLRVLRPEGRLVCIGLQGGSRGELDLALLLRRRLTVRGSTLRALPVARKGALVQRFSQTVLPLLATGEVVPVIDRVLPLTQAAAAHQALQGPHVGKIVLRVHPEDFPPGPLAQPLRSEG